MGWAAQIQRTERSASVAEVLMMIWALGSVDGKQARIQGVGAGARAHPWGGVSPFKMHYSVAFKNQSITGHPPLGEILYPPLVRVTLRP